MLPKQLLLTIPYFFGTLLFLFLARYVNKTEKSRRAVFFSLTMIIMGMNLLSYALVILSDSLRWIIFFERIQYTTSQLFTILWLLFAIYYFINNSFSFNRKNSIIAGIIAVLPLFSLVVYWTNPNGLLWSSFVLHDRGLYRDIITTLTPFYWIQFLYHYTLFLAGTILILVRIWSMGKQYRKQAIVVTIGAVITLLWTIFGYVMIIEGRTLPIKFSPFGYLFGGMVFTWGIFHTKFLDLAPIAMGLVFKNMRDMIFVLNTENRIIELNEAAKTSLSSGVFAKKHDTFTGSNILEVFDCNLQLKPVLADVSVGETEIEVRRDGETIHFRIKVDEIKDNHQATIGKVVKFIDVTDMKNALMKLFEVKRMSALGSLVAGVAHEINTPVGISLMASSTLASETQQIAEKFKSDKISKKEFKDFLNIANQTAALILNNLERTATLIQSFTQVSVDQSTEQKRKFNIKDYTEDIIRSITPELKNKNVEIKLDINEDYDLDSYPGVFAQIITNLVINSITHAYNDNEAGEIELSARLVDGMYYFVYLDNGKGISSEDIDRIFEPFYKGIGLGLHIVYNLVTQKLKGSITCESIPGEGAKFHISIPA